MLEKPASCSLSFSFRGIRFAGRCEKSCFPLRPPVFPLWGQLQSQEGGSCYPPFTKKSFFYLTKNNSESIIYTEYARNA